jgi:hypothetical protein
MRKRVVITGLAASAPKTYHLVGNLIAGSPGKWTATMIPAVTGHRLRVGSMGGVGGAGKCRMDRFAYFRSWLRTSGA